jgi:hypothetical protein
MLILLSLILILIAISIALGINLYKSRTKKPSFENQITDKIDTFIDTVEEKQLTPEHHFTLGELYQFGKFGKNKSSHLALVEYNKVIQTTHDVSLKGKTYMNKAKIYEELQPINISNILDNYLKALECGFEESIICIGKIYIHGLHPYYLPDKLIASRIFSTFDHFSPTLQPWCNYYLKEINFDLKYIDLDTIPQHKQIVRYLPDNIVNLMQHSASKITKLTPYTSIVNQTDLQKFEIQDTDDPEVVFNKIPKNIIKNDSQNVHDHSLQNIGKQIIQVLENKSSIHDHNTQFQQNVQNLLNNISENDKKVVQRVCESFADVKHSRYDKSEKEIFNLVYDKIKKNDDHLIIFVDNITSCIENDVIVCSTGKIMRMLSTLDVIDADTPTLKPDWVIKNEISQIISKTINDLSKSQKDEYNSEHNERIVNLIKTKVHSKCKNDYKNVMDDSILDIYLQDYFQYL